MTMSILDFWVELLSWQEIDLASWQALSECPSWPYDDALYIYCLLLIFKKDKLYHAMLRIEVTL